MKTLLCVHLFMHMCVCVYQSARSLLSASERLISLIEARRRPSTPRPRGIAAETHKQKGEWVIIILKYLRRIY